jgi:hypothetical protein
MSRDELESVLHKIQHAREAIEVEFEDKEVPPRLMRAHDDLVSAAVIILNQKV